MTNFSINSIQCDTYAFFNPFPSHLSGTAHEMLIFRKIKYIENYLAVTINQDSIDDKYYQPLFDLTVASVLANMQATDSASASSVRLGDFSFGDKTGGGSDVEKSKIYFEQQGREGLENLKFMSYNALVYKAT